MFSHAPSSPSCLVSLGLPVHSPLPKLSTGNPAVLWRQAPGPLSLEKMGVVRSVAEARALGGGRRACFSPFLPSQLQAQAVGPERPEQGSGVSGLSRGQSRA